MATRMKRTTTFPTPDQHERLRRLAYERHTSVARTIREAALEVLEDAEDVQIGTKALADEEGTVTWEEYQRPRTVRQRRVPAGNGQQTFPALQKGAQLGGQL